MGTASQGEKISPYCGDQVYEKVMQTETQITPEGS